MAFDYHNSDFDDDNADIGLTCNPDMLELGHQLTVEAAKSFPSQESASLLRQHVVHPEDTYISMNLVYLHIIVISLIKRYIHISIFCWGVPE